MTPISAIATFLLAALLTIGVGALAWTFGAQRFAFTAWAQYMTQRAWARFFDHRDWIVGIGLAAFASSLGRLFILPHTLQPTTQSDYSTVKYAVPPGSQQNK